MLSSAYYKQKIIGFFSVLKSNIRFDNHCGATDINKECEDFFINIFNTIYDLNLINLNTEKKNYPGLDIGDYDKRIAFQITYDNKKTKIIHTLEEIQKYNLKKVFDSCKILILSEKKQYKLDNLKPLMDDLLFNPETDIIDLKNVLTEINKCDLNKIEYIANYIQRQFSNPSSLWAPSFLVKAPPLSMTDRIEEIYQEICNTITWDYFDRIRNFSFGTKIRKEVLDPIFYISSLYEKIGSFAQSVVSMRNFPEIVQQHLSKSNNLCIAAMEFEDKFFQQACPGDNFYTFVTRDQYNGIQRDYWRAYIKETEEKFQKFIKTFESDFMMK